MASTRTTRYGLPTAAEIAGRTGREILQAMIDGELPRPPIAETLSLLLTEVGDGFAVFEVVPGPHLLNPMGFVHGGVALTLVDSACGCAGQSVLAAGVGYTTIETKANFTRPITADTGRIRAEGRVIARGRQIITTECRILSHDGKVLAHGTSTLLVLGGR